MSYVYICERENTETMPMYTCNRCRLSFSPLQSSEKSSVQYRMPNDLTEAGHRQHRGKK